LQDHADCHGCRNRVACVSNSSLLNLIGYVRTLFGFQLAIDVAEVTNMSLRKKLVIFAVAAVAAIAGLGLDQTILKNAVTVVASAVWGS
jgi:hypothetical protein